MHIPRFICSCCFNLSQVDGHLGHLAVVNNAEIIIGAQVSESLLKNLLGVCQGVKSHCHVVTVLLFKELPNWFSQWFHCFGVGSGNPLQFLAWRIPWTGYSPWSCKESDTTGRLTHHVHCFTFWLTSLHFSPTFVMLLFYYCCSCPSGFRTVSLWFCSAFPWWLMMFRIFSCAHWPLVYLWRNSYTNPLSIM